MGVRGGYSIGTTFNAFNFVKLGGDLAALMLDLPTPDRSGDGVFNVGDYVNQAYDDCAYQRKPTHENRNPAPLHTDTGARLSPMQRRQHAP